MAAEIERKFLLDGLPPGLDRHRSVEIEQGYLVADGEAEVRLRRAEETRTLTVKRGSGEERDEVETELAPAQFEALWEACRERLAKRRHLVPLDDGLEAEVDVYAGSLAGLAVAEVEFPSGEAARSFKPPDWFGPEVTGDNRYANKALARSGMPSPVAGSDGGHSYSLEKDEPLGEGLTAIAAGRAGKALERLREGASGEEVADAVHGARKDMKKLRTVLRLLRDRLPKGVYEEENRRYRDAGRALSASRDAEVKLQTLEALAEQADELPEDAVETWRQILARDREAAANAGDEGPIAEAIELIEAGREGIGRWGLEGDSWETIGGGLKRVYRRGRRAMKDSEAEPSEASVHEWRKRAKDLRYALELLEDAWDGPLEATAAEAHRLTDLLGDHHDLAVLREDLHQRRLGEEETRQLEAAITARQHQLATNAFPLGQRLYAERAKAFNRRLRRYWDAWRG